MSFHVPEDRRVRRGTLGSDESYGNNGAFEVPSVVPGTWLNVIASDGAGWEHVSVSVNTQKRIPSWPEMQHVKEMFWDDEDCVLQYHPPRSVYVNYHPGTLHLWRPVGVNIPVPDPALVGPPPPKRRIRL